MCVRYECAFVFHVNVFIDFIIVCYFFFLFVFNVEQGASFFFFFDLFFKVVTFSFVGPIRRLLVLECSCCSN